MFAPLALTQALPYLPLAQGSIDYQVERRADPGLIDRTLREAGARVVLTRNGLHQRGESSCSHHWHSPRHCRICRSRRAPSTIRWSGARTRG